MFFGSFFGRGKNKKGFGMGSMFDDDFFSGGFGKMGGGFGGQGMSSFTSSTSFGGRNGGGGGLSKSISTVTKTVNGKTVTIKKTMTMKDDGTKDVVEETTEGGKKI